MGNRTVIDAFVGEFYRYRSLAEEAMAQVSPRDLYARLNPMQNSISAIVQHMYGDMVSRWTPLLRLDGGNGARHMDRDRDEAFFERALERDVLMSLWHRGWARVFDTLDSLEDADMGRVVRVANQPHTVAMALSRRLAHYAWHAGQIALIARHFVGEEWRYFTIPPGGETREPIARVEN